MNITYKAQKEKVVSEPDKYLEFGQRKRYFALDGKKIKYLAVSKSYNFSDPEEKIRAEYYFDLIEKYNYPAKRIDLEIKTKPDKDVACGSGGFLLHALDKVRSKAKEYFKEEPSEQYRYWHNFAQNNLFGIEINDSIARVAKMNMIIHDDGHSNIIGFDALEDIDKINRKNPSFGKNRFDVIVTNPPFGANIKLSEHPYLEKYFLGKDKTGKKTKSNQKTEILFIERCIDFLKAGNGQMAIVLPDGILTNSSLQFVRDYLMEKTQILAVVSLPQFAFTHFGAGVKSSLVFVRKRTEAEKLGRYPIFMAIAEHIGYNATGRKDSKNDLDKICQEFKKFKSKNNF